MNEEGKKISLNDKIVTFVSNNIVWVFLGFIVIVITLQIILLNHTNFVVSNEFRKIIFSIISSLMIFFLGILYKIFDIKYTKLLEIKENEEFCKSWIKIISDIFKQYRNKLYEYTLAIKDYSYIGINFPIYDFQEEKILNISTDKLFNFYITNREKKGKEKDFYNFIKSLKLICYYNSTLEKLFLENKKYEEEYQNSTNNLIHEFEEEILRLTEPNYNEIRIIYNDFAKLNLKYTELLKTKVYDLFKDKYYTNPTDEKILSLFNKISRIKSKIFIQENSIKRYSDVLIDVVNDMEMNIEDLNIYFKSLTDNKIYILYKIR